MREAATLAAVTRRRGPLPAPQARRWEREGRTSALLVLPSSGCRGTAPQAAQRNHAQPSQVSTIGLLRASPCTPRGGNRKARFPPRAPLSRPLRSAMGRCLPSRPRPTVRDHRQRAFPPMVGNSTQAMASELCKLTAPSSLLVLPSPDRRAPARAAANHLVGPRPSGLPTAMRNITLLPSAWGEKKAVTSSSKNVSPVAPRPRANAAR